MEQYDVIVKTLGFRIMELERYASQLQIENKQLTEELAKANTVTEEN